MAGKYTPLEKYLLNLPKNQGEATLSFERIEQILGERLPQSAYKHRSWWSNEKDGQHVQAHSWLGAGWKVEVADLSRQLVRFVRSF